MKAYHWRAIIEDRARLARLRKNAPAPDAPPVNVTLPPMRERPPVKDLPPDYAPGVPMPERVAPERTMPRITMLAATTPGRSICVECKHYEYRSCTNPRARHPVSGEYVDAHAARKNRESCGAQGRYWDARPARQRVVRVDDGSEPMEYVPPVPVRRLEPFVDGVVAVLWDPSYREPPPPEPVFGKKYRGPAPGFTAMQLALAAIAHEANPLS